MNDNIFQKNKFWIFAFLTVFVVFMFFYCKNAEGLFFDIPSTFFAVFFNSDISGKFLIYIDERVRYFNNFLVAIPFNIIFPFIKNMPVINALKAFLLSYLVVHFLLLICNYLIALRTKRYDIAAIAYLFYAVFTLPSIIWVIRECHIAFLFYFALLSYFLSKEKLNAKDMIPISLILVYMFESFETTIVLGIILFVFTILYSKKEDINPWHKAVIGFVSLFAALYMIIKMIYLYFANNVGVSTGLNQWINGFIAAVNNVFAGNSIITIFAIIASIIVIFYKKNIGVKSILFFVPLLFGLFYALKIQTGFVSNPNIELHNYTICLLFIFPVIISILLLDYYNIDLNKSKPFIFSNIIIIASIFGIINLFWQINTSFEFVKLQNYLINLSDNSSETLITIPKEDMEKYNFLKFNSCFGSMQRLILLSTPQKPAKVIVPNNDFCDYSEYCYDDIDRTYFDRKKNILYLQTAMLKNDTKYWDLSEIIKEFEKNERIRN